MPIRKDATPYYKTPLFIRAPERQMKLPKEAEYITATSFTSPRQTTLRLGWVHSFSGPLHRGPLHRPPLSRCTKIAGQTGP